MNKQLLVTETDHRTTPLLFWLKQFLVDNKHPKMIDDHGFWGSMDWFFIPLIILSVNTAIVWGYTTQQRNLVWPGISLYVYSFNLCGLLGGRLLVLCNCEEPVFRQWVWIVYSYSLVQGSVRCRLTSWSPLQLLFRNLNLTPETYCYVHYCRSPHRKRKGHSGSTWLPQVEDGSSFVHCTGTQVVFS